MIQNKEEKQKLTPRPPVSSLIMVSFVHTQIESCIEIELYVENL